MKNFILKRGPLLIVIFIVLKIFFHLFFNQNNNEIENLSEINKILFYSFFINEVLMYLFIGAFLYLKLKANTTSTKLLSVLDFVKNIVLFSALIIIPNILISVYLKKDQPDPHIIYTLAIAIPFWFYVLIQIFINTAKESKLFLIANIGLLLLIPILTLFSIYLILFIDTSI